MLDVGGQKDLDLAAAMAAPYLKGFALIVGGALLHQSMQALCARDDTFATEKRRTAQFFIGNLLPLAKANLEVSVNGSSSI